MNMRKAVVLAAAAVATLALAPQASAAEVPVDPSGSFETSVPATPGASLSLSLAGKSYTVAVPATSGGTLALSFSGNTTAVVDVVVSDCAAPAVGKIITVTGFSQGTQVKATFTSPITGPLSTDTGSLTKGNSTTASLCSVTQ